MNIIKFIKITAKLFWIFLSQRIELTQTFTHIHRITVSSGSCLQSKKHHIHFVVAMLYIEQEHRAFILKRCKPGSEDCVECFTDLWWSRHVMNEKITLVRLIIQTSIKATGAMSTVEQIQFHFTFLTSLCPKKSFAHSVQQTHNKK